MAMMRCSSFVEKIKADDIRVRFFGISPDDQEWDNFGEFDVHDIHKSVAIVLKTPPYKNLSADEPVAVGMQMVRPSDGTVSETRQFTYHPDVSDDLILAKKRKKMPSYLNHPPPMFTPQPSSLPSSGNHKSKLFNLIQRRMNNLKQDLSSKFIPDPQRSHSTVEPPLLQADIHIYTIPKTEISATEQQHALYPQTLAQHPQLDVQVMHAQAIPEQMVQGEVTPHQPHPGTSETQPCLQPIIQPVQYFTQQIHSQLLMSDENQPQQPQLGLTDEEMKQAMEELLTDQVQNIESVTHEMNDFLVNLDLQPTAIHPHRLDTDISLEFIPVLGSDGLDNTTYLL